MTPSAWAVVVALFAAQGAFLFGLDIGYIAPILNCASFKRDVAHLPDWADPSSKVPGVEEGFIVSIFSLGCLIASLPCVSGYFLDTWGRRASIMLGSFVFLIGVAVQVSASSIRVMSLGRFIAGCSIGVLSTVVSLYQSEIAPPSMRGALTSLYQLMITFGILVAAFIDTIFVEHESGWRFVIAIQAVPASALLGGMYFMPRSPRWLVQRGKSSDAMQVLLSIRGEADAQQELKEILASHEEAMSFGQQPWNQLIRGRVGQLLCIGCALQLLQQMVGMNAFMYFGPRIFRSLGLRENVFQTINNAVNFVSTFPAIFFADRCGRKVLLICGAVGMTISCIVMGAIGLVAISQTGDGWVISNNIAVIVLSAMIFTFVANFAYGWGPIVWVYCVEIYPLQYRSRCLGVTTASNWVGNYFVAQFTPVLFESIGFGTFFVFGGFAIVALSLAIWLPETRGVSLESVGQLFDERLGVGLPARPNKNQQADHPYGMVIGNVVEDDVSLDCVDDVAVSVDAIASAVVEA